MVRNLVNLSVSLYHYHCAIMMVTIATAFFIRPFYKMMLRKPVTLDDMQSVVRPCDSYFVNTAIIAQFCLYLQDVELWNSFTYILENDPEPLCLDFSVNKTVFDKVHAPE